MTKSSPLILRYVVSVKSMVKISSISVAFLVIMNFRARPSSHLHETWGDPLKNPKNLPILYIGFWGFFQRVLWNNENKSCLNVLKFLKFHEFLNKPSKFWKCQLSISCWTLKYTRISKTHEQGDLVLCRNVLKYFAEFSNLFFKKWKNKVL